MGEPRLVITHLELENFKSYAGVQRIGPFHKARAPLLCPHLRPGVWGDGGRVSAARVLVCVCGDAAMGGCVCTGTRPARRLRWGWECNVRPDAFAWGMAWGGAGGGSAYESRITIHQRRSTIALRGTRGACGGMATSPCPGLTKPRHP